MFWSFCRGKVNGYLYEGGFPGGGEKGSPERTEPNWEGNPLCLLGNTRPGAGQKKWEAGREAVQGETKQLGGSWRESVRVIGIWENASDISHYKCRSMNRLLIARCDWYNECNFGYFCTNYVGQYFSYGWGQIISFNSSQHLWVPTTC